jgi:hypothetical protein
LGSDLYSRQGCSRLLGGQQQGAGLDKAFEKKKRTKDFKSTCWWGRQGELQPLVEKAVRGTSLKNSKKIQNYNEVQIWSGRTKKKNLPCRLLDGWEFLFLMLFL